tara:strand:- start:9266 stop:10141 length:876 start_codon:yes stop_codon:yes gene_type:complete
MAGSGGMLGEAFYRVFNEKHNLKCTDIDVNEPWLDYLDFRDADKYREDVINFAPDVLFHIGAHTSLEYCEENPDDAYRTNTLSVEYATQIANELDIPILYISTAGIFDGSKNMYDDWDKPNPLGVYARSKYLGEKYVMENAKMYLVCRAGWMMGGGANKDKKFINKLIEQINNGAKTLNIVNDKDGTPTYTVDFAQNVLALLETKKWGLYNMVCGGQTSREEVCRELLSILNLEDKVSIKLVSSDFFAKEYFAPRPPCERLINRRLDLIDCNRMRNWKISLKEYIKDYYSN